MSYIFGATASPPRFLPVLDIPTILAAGGTDYVRDPVRTSTIRLLAPTSFATSANALTTPPRGWTAPAGGATSAAVSGGVLTITGNGSGTAPQFSRAMVRGTTSFVRQWRWGITSGTAINNTMVYGFAPGVYFDLYNTAGGSGPLQVRVFGIPAGVVGTAVTFTASEMASKVWMMAQWGLGSVDLWYNKTNIQAAPTTGWTKIGTYDIAQPGSNTWVEYMGPGASTSQVVTYEGIRGWSTPDSNTDGLTTPDLNCEGFVGTSTAVVIAQPNFGSGGNLPDITDWRLRLTDAVNRIPGDTAAWVFGFTGSNTSLVACTEPTTYQSASTLQLKLPGTDTVTTSTFQYWQVWTKCTSTGNTQPGSIDLARLPGVYAGP